MIYENEPCGLEENSDYCLVAHWSVCSGWFYFVVEKKYVNSKICPNTYIPNTYQQNIVSILGNSMNLTWFLFTCFWLLLQIHLNKFHRYLKLINHVKYFLLIKKNICHFGAIWKQIATLLKRLRFLIKIQNSFITIVNHK